MQETLEHSPAGPSIPETFVPVDIPVPPNAAAAFGYPGTADYVAFYWEPVGDELCYDDGRIAGTGSWHPFLQYRSHKHVAPALKVWNLGYSDEEAEHWLVMESQRGKAWIAEIADARVFLREQHPALPALRMVDIARIREEIRVAVSQRTITAKQMREVQQRQQEHLRALLSFCDTWQRT
jgi:hypothetical protein